MKIICRHKELLNDFDSYSGIKPYENEVIADCPTCNTHFSISIGEYAGHTNMTDEEGFKKLKKEVIEKPTTMNGLDIIE